MKTTMFAKTLIKIRAQNNIDIEQLKAGIVKECEESKPFIGNSVSPAFQNLYQKVTDSMILLNNRTYEAIIGKIFNISFQSLSSIYFIVIKFIIYIVGSITYTDASDTILQILENYIIITLILYIIYEIVLFIFFFFVYIFNIGTECKNMFSLKCVFEITNSIEN